MENRTPFIAGNWKMFKTCPEAAAAAAELSRIVEGVSDVDIMIAPPFTALSQVLDAIKGGPECVTVYQGG